jgi:hypothetical protein
MGIEISTEICIHYEVVDLEERNSKLHRRLLDFTLLTLCCIQTPELKLILHI